LGITGEVRQNAADDPRLLIPGDIILIETSIEFRTGFSNEEGMDISDAVSEYKNSTAITLDVTAGSKKTVFPSGYNEWRNAVQCKIGAQPIEGKANKVILSAVSEFFKVPAGNVSIISGATSSLKRIQVDGITVADAKTLLKDAIAKAKQN